MHVRGGAVPLLAVATAVCTLAIAAAAIAARPAAAGSYAQPDRVLVGTTGNDSERVPTLDIGTVPGAEPRVVMSLRATRFGSLASGDRLRASAELEVTTDCLALEARCVGQPYGYDPTVSAQLVLAPDAASVGGPLTVPVSNPRAHRCAQRLPNREHHCVLVFQWPFVDLVAPLPPCMAASACYLNLVAEAYNPLARPGDLLIVGEDEPDGTIKQDKGRVNAIRIRPDVPGSDPRGRVRTHFSTTPAASALQVGDAEDRNETVVASRRVPWLGEGDQLAAWANMTADISHLP